MKSLRIVLSVFLLLLTTAGVAQSDAQKSFDILKTLARSWQGNGYGGPARASGVSCNLQRLRAHE